MFAQKVDIVGSPLDVDELHDPSCNCFTVRVWVRVRKKIIIGVL
jgi:hypothetical protein